MKSPFISLPFDRMQNVQFKAMYNELINDLSKQDLKCLELDRAFVRFVEQQPLLKNLNKKYRKYPQTTDLVKLRKECDDLISALLLHIKALKRANFADQRGEIALIFTPVRKIFQNAVHLGTKAKEGKINTLLLEINRKDTFYAAFEKLSLLRYATELENVKGQINSLSTVRDKLKNEQPVGVTIPAKEQLISELRLFLKTIEITVITYPDKDYELVINCVNLIMTGHRTYLRNIKTRRVKAKLKAEEKINL